MLNEVLVGTQSQSGDGAVVKARGGRQGDQIMSELHARYYEQTYRGSMFSVNTQGTAITTTAALATTWTGLGVSNPAGSGVNLVINKFTVAQFAVGAASTIGILGGVGVLAASLAIQSRILGSGIVSKANASAGATISTPLLILNVGSVGSVATGSIPLIPGIVADLEGSLIVPPGSFIGTYTSIVTTSALNFGFCWEEVPI